MKGPLARSLTLRLLTIFIAMGLVVLILLASLFTSGLAGQWRRSIQPHLSQYVEYVQRDLGMPPEVARADDIAASVPVDIVLFQHGRLVHATTDTQPDFSRIPFNPADRRLARRLTEHSEGPRPQVLIGRKGPTRILQVRQGDWTVFYLLNPRLRRRADHDFLLIALAAVGFVLVAGWWIIRRQLRPIASITQTVTRISDGDLQARTGIDGHDDLATLGGRIDGMAERLQGMLDAKRELLLSVSHELRSPLTRARVALELLPESSAKQRVGRDLIAMSELIDGLLESERLREAHAVLNTQTLDLLALVTEITTELEDQHNVSLTVDSPDTAIIIEADAARLRVLARTLIHNAIVHGKPAMGDSVIRVALSAEPEAARLTVQDNGPGISPEHLDRVTEAFERLDASRSRSTGGVGLGLNLARLVAEAHGGSLTLSKAAEGGLCATVQLPIHQPKPGAPKQPR